MANIPIGNKDVYNPHCGEILQQPTTFPTDRPIFYNQKLQPAQLAPKNPDVKRALTADTMVS